MEGDSPSKYEEFSKQNYQQQQSLKYSNNEQPSTLQSNKFGADNQRLNDQSTGNNPWNTGPATPWNKNVSPDLRKEFKLSDQEIKVLRNCTSSTFYGLTLPSCLGYIVFSQYSSLKNLKPVSLFNISLNTMLIYLFTKLAAAPFCFNELKKANPKIEEKLAQFRKTPYQTPNYPNQVPNAYQTPVYPNQVPNSYQVPSYPNQAPNSYQVPVYPQQQQKFNNSLFTGNQQQPKSSEFVEDNFDVSSDYNK